MKVAKIIVGLIVIAFFIALFIVGPLIGLWSLNTLFPVLAIPYAVKTWFAMLFLQGLLAASFVVNQSRK